MSSTPDDLDRHAAEWGVAPALAALAESDALSPPGALRDRLLRAAATEPPRLAEPAGPIELYSNRVQAMQSLLATLPVDAWSRPALPYSWTVHGLVAHLLVIERYAAAAIGLRAMPDEPVDDHLAMGAATIAAELAGPPAATAQRWFDETQGIIAAVSAPGFDLAAPAPLHGWPFSASTSLVVRAFELWTHTDDIARAAGIATAGTPAGELRAMSSLSVGSLPFTLGSVAPGVEMAPARVVLTGSGGGTFDIGGPGERRALVVADVVDYCRLVARRIEPQDLEMTVEGDAGFVHHLLRAAQVFAM